MYLIAWYIRPVILVLGLLLCAGSCNYVPNPSVDDNVLAEVYGNRLYLEDLGNFIPSNTPTEDSLYMLNSFVTRWVRDKLLMQEAESNIPADLNVDKLVQDYRASLILVNYEKQLLGQQLDSTVLESEIQSYYNDQKEAFRLMDDIVQYYYVKITTESEERPTFEQLWKEASTSESELKHFSSRNASAYSLDSTIWYKVADFKEGLPDKIASKIREGQSYEWEDEGYAYYLTINHISRKGDLPPYSYLRKRVESFILHQRQRDLIEHKKDELYDREIKGNHVKILID